MKWNKGKIKTESLQPNTENLQNQKHQTVNWNSSRKWQWGKWIISIFFNFHNSIFKWLFSFLLNFWCYPSLISQWCRFSHFFLHFLLLFYIWKDLNPKMTHSFLHHIITLFSFTCIFLIVKLFHVDPSKKKYFMLMIVMS